MPDLPLELDAEHLFVRLDGRRWLIDSGAPSSFGTVPELELDGVRFPVPSGALGLTADRLSALVGTSCNGLLGVDVLGALDLRFDVAGGTLAVSADELAHDGALLELDECLGVPIVRAEIAGVAHRMFLDTGAPIAYFQGDALGGFPPGGRVRDFFPGAGEFETDVHLVPMRVGPVELSVRCGRLPGLLGAALALAGVTGIVGNALLRDRVVSWFPRRRRLGL